ncbi:MAG: DUF58 domain-containing protein [Acidobacteria bacterium]|nr:DUF58 domain-containing protein [Acidobacteriota bacterium]
MISKELAKKIRLLEITTNRAVNDVLAGEYHSVFKGRGMEFDEVREYAPGDDVRTIDWNVTARLGKPFVKRFVEERELTVMFIVDLSASGSFGSRGQLKNEVAAELCALLAFSAIKNNDKVGLLAFTDRIEKFIPPKKGSSHVLRLVRELLNFSPQGRGTDLAQALEYVGRVVRRRAIVFLVSDFLAPDYVKPLRLVARRHDLVAVSVSDPREKALPNVGLIALEDAETGQTVIFDSGSNAARKAYAGLARKRDEERQALFRKVGVDEVRVNVGEDYVRDLMLFFRRREQRL